MTEIAFTFYISVFELSNIIGQVMKLGSFYLGKHHDLTIGGGFSPIVPFPHRLGIPPQLNDGVVYGRCEGVFFGAGDLGWSV